MDTLEKIVRDIAADCNPLDYEYGYCMYSALCGKPGYSFVTGEDKPHAPECPWLRAVNWVREHPV